MVWRGQRSAFRSPPEGGHGRLKSDRSSPLCSAMDLFPQWFKALEERHLGGLSFQEVRRAVQALSSLYVERRDRMSSNAIFDGAGKRAAFAFYFAPLHFLLVREVIRALGGGRYPMHSLLDLGCGIGSAGAAWASELPSGTRISG